jgi:hypothetical protein
MSRLHQRSGRTGRFPEKDPENIYDETKMESREVATSPPCFNILLSISAKKNASRAKKTLQPIL